MRITIDRFEGGFAVCEKEDRTMLNVKRDKLPANAKAGDVLIIKGDTIKIDTTSTAKRKRVVEKLMDNIFQDDNKQ